MTITLQVEKRDATGTSARTLRRAGALPGVVYGAHKESTPVTVDARAFDKVLRSAGESSIVALQGLGEELPTLIHEVDLDPLTHRPRHVDFYAVTKGEKIEIEIPLNFVGDAPAVKAGHNVVKALHELEIKADPMNLPHAIDVDLTKLENVGDKIHASDLVIPSGVELVTSADEVVALVQEVVEEKIEAAPVADLSTIEVEKKGKEEESPATEGSNQSAAA